MTVTDFIPRPGQYLFWMLATAVFCTVLERLFRWRRSQPMWRRNIIPDIILLFFNGHFFGIMFAYVTTACIRWVQTGAPGVQLPDPARLALLGSTPLWVQFIAFFLIKDFLEWLIHNLLHRVGFLWKFHKLHHSIVEMDWIGNFRFHWFEIIVYRSLTWLPLVALGVDDRVILPMAVLTTLIGDLNHANIRISWGPLVYVLNSSRMHIWHHDEECHLPSGQNFGIVLSLWDWLFRTAYYPADRDLPDHLGFKGMESFPGNPLKYLFYPLFSGSSRKTRGEDE